MYIIDARMAPPPPVASVSGAAASATATANRYSVLDHSNERAAHARRVFRTALGHLTDDDRALIRAVTGEAIWPGQSLQEKDLSAFALQIAVDRRTAVIPAGVEIRESYLVRTRELFDRLGVSDNPFSGANLQRALAFLHRRGSGRIDVAL